MTTTAKAVPARVPRRIDHLHSYGPLLRISDRVAGWRDRRLLAADPPQRPVASTPYTARLQSTFDEIDRRTFALAQDQSRNTATRLRELVADLIRVDGLIADAEAGLLQVAARPSPEELQARNGGELHLSEHAVATRRSREHGARVAREQLTLTRLKSERSQHLTECARSAAVLTEVFELSRSLSERLRHFYNRRITTYARHARFGVAAIPTIPAPPWTSQPCPWLPHAWERYLSAAQPAIACSQCCPQVE